MERRPDRVLVFVAVLELARMGALDIAQSRYLGPVVVEARGPIDDSELAALSQGA
jgi:chromatin segregation and condensation protein Rec8/ScpA/Scc1 (kleisin family)